MEKVKNAIIEEIAKYRKLTDEGATKMHEMIANGEPKQEIIDQNHYLSKLSAKEDALRDLMRKLGIN